ncbi:MAG: hypothetical protein K2X11_07790 [Acetobacteraceae bacterium]|nr:hypothetical protein [Acetobacteraceae bacterium]
MKITIDTVKAEEPFPLNWQNEVAAFAAIHGPTINVPHPRHGIAWKLGASG